VSEEIRTIDIHHAGTAMRFLTAFFAIQNGVDVVLTGSPRMKERPIEVLVDALNTLMLDARDALEIGPAASAVENQAYVDSWQAPGEPAPKMPAGG
jgi:5-enolpyruvylshikimate-3-phosphate synthase